MRRRPDLLDFDQVITRLDLSRKIARRLQRQRAFARPSLTFHGESIWSWTHVKRWARHPRRSLREPIPSSPTVDPVDTTMIASRLGVPKKVILHWHRSRRLALPDYRWGGRDVWLWSTIEAWVHSYSRRVAAASQPPNGSDPIAQLDELAVSLRNLQYLDVPPPLGVPLDLLGEELSGDRRDLDGLRDRMGDIAAFIDRVDGGKRLQK
ncbi:MAG: hypothetical protein HKN74_03060 [Acidimicrobiia bacterium]|nr:hypothetical protein [Acidimicrobiia bacterium]